MFLGAPTSIHPNIDPMVLMQAGVDMADLKLCLSEVELESKSCEVELMHLHIRAMELDRTPHPATSTQVAARSPAITP